MDEIAAEDDEEDMGEIDPLANDPAPSDDGINHIFPVIPV